MPRPQNTLLSSFANLCDKNFLQRLITAILVGGFVLWLLMTENPYISYFIILLGGGVMYEWAKIIARSKRTLVQRSCWLILGTIYMVCGLLGFYEFYTYAPILGLSLLFIIWSADIGAYIAGRLIGGPKIAPSISPGKTWSGSFGGLICSSIVAIVIIVNLYEGMNWWMFTFFLLVNLLAQLGDLIESKVKRLFQIKDSGSFLPGHGGLIDRLDSLFLIGCCLYAIHWFVQFHKIFQF